MASDAMKKTFALVFARDLADNFNNDNEDQYFLFFGKIDSWVNSPYNSVDDATNGPATNIDCVERSNYALRDGVAAKRISSRNIYHMIPRYDWTYGTSYDEYDDTIDLFGTSKTFFVYTSSGNVYKCIENNSGSVSQYEPNHTITTSVSYSDGYKWKFICKVLEDAQDFTTNSYIPVQLAEDNSDNILNQWNAQQDSINGSIDYIKVTVPSSGFTAAAWIKSSYSATHTETTDSEIGENSPLGGTDIVLTSAESNENDYYNGYAIYISSGPGVGQRRVITDYDGSDRRVYFTDPLTSELNKSGGGFEGSKYKIIPNIVFNGDGVSAAGIPLLNSSYEITNISMINNGSDYTIAELEIYPTSVSGGNVGESGIAGPTFAALIPPYGGHANNVLNEFNSSNIMIKTVLKALDANFNTAQDFRQISIIKNPKLLGGTNDGKIAGTEITRRKQLTVTQPYFSSQNFNDSSFIAGNSIMGETTKATAKIEQWVTDASDPSIGTLELSNVQGNLDIEDPASALSRLVFSSGAAGSTGTLTVGNIVKQTNDGIVAVGKIKYWNAPSGGPYELIVDVTANSFSSDSNSVIEYDSTGSAVTGVDWNGTDVVERKMGELIKHFSSAPGTTFEFKLFPETTGYQNIARSNKLTDVQDEETLEKSYRLTTKLVIEDTTTNLTDGSYTKDNTFYQVTLDTGITGSTVKGKIVDWEKTSGSTGILYLNDVRGSFVTGGFSGSSNHGITAISLPEFKVGSGEVLYIQNIRPVTRNVEQDEEIKIMIGF